MQSSRTLVRGQRVDTTYVGESEGVEIREVSGAIGGDECVAAAEGAGRWELGEGGLGADDVVTWKRVRGDHKGTDHNDAGLLVIVHLIVPSSSLSACSEKM